nr:L-2-amino-thiazoline-4-carboxylic acid hydrolase [Desulfobacterales bacterium]
AADVFESTIVKDGDCCKQQMTRCALLDAWKDLGCTTEEIDLCCDIAMELDRSRAAYHGLGCEIPMRMGKGDRYCSVVLRDRE